MTLAALPPALRLSRRELLLAAGLGLLLGAGMQVPRMIACGLGGDDCHEAISSGLRDWLGEAGWIAGLWLLAMITHRWLPADEARRPVGLGLQIVALTLLSPVLGAALGQTGGSMTHRNPYDLQVQLSFVLGACLALEYHHRRQAADAAARRFDTAALSRRLDQARMALLQAQVEPHFLFNTLAHLRLLARSDAQAARAMLADLRLYLDAALPELRQSQTSLARELELVRAFLALHQRRIGPERLRLRFEIAPGLDEVVVPSTCLLTLAENAVKHGITPQVAGGEILVRAGPDPEEPQLLRLEVADTGVGMGAGSGGGTGLVTLRARLAALYGEQARLSLHLNQPQGLIARVQLPGAPR